MKNQPKLNGLLEKHNPTSFKEQQKLADHYLNKITMLREQLNIEEQNLIRLIRSCGTGIVIS